MDTSCEILIKKAYEAAEFAYSPYSKFKVGASLLCKSGKIYTGCNIENATYGATVCAERVAISKAVSEGEHEFEAICIVGSDGEYCSPCGICRQALSEFCSKELKIILTNSNKEVKILTLGELLPFAFDLNR